MNVVSTSDDLANYLTQAAEVSRDHPVVISKYIEQAKEIVCREMIGAAELNPPLEVDAGTGPNWLDAK